MMRTDEPISFYFLEDVQMKPCPVNPAWVIDGAPIARNSILSRSLDGSATTLLWDCTTGTFHWHYDIDETVYVLEGSAVIKDNSGVERNIGPGDHVLFRANSHAIWRVEKYIRKVAFCRSPVPGPLMFLMRVLRRLRKILGAAPSDGAVTFTSA